MRISYFTNESLYIVIIIICNCFKREFEFYSQKRGEISVKGKGIMTTYWVFGKGVAINQIVSHGPMQAGVPQATTPSLQRQSSHHTSLAAVVYGMMQASKRTTNMNATTRKLIF